MRKSHVFLMVGLFLGLGAPLGALLLRCVLSPLPLHACLRQEWLNDSFFYVYMLVGTCLVIALFGFIIGAEEDTVLKKNVALSDQVVTDPLTGLGNHRFLHDVFKIEFRKHQTSRQPISCVMMDLDHFKRINDNFGHPFGDHVLKQFASILRRCVREGDTLARYGGEEFLCILPNCDGEQVRAVAERIRKATEAHPFTHKENSVRLTVSLGAVTSYESTGLNYRQLIALSDQALYEAKGKGRNRLVQASIRMDQKARQPVRAAHHA
ncbi:MAG TPA: GGDEF domain-containing protein [bacterium]|nr:GGDEF domain-containing protein [bacterium]